MPALLRLLLDVIFVGALIFGRRWLPSIARLANPILFTSIFAIIYVILNTWGQAPAYVGGQGFPVLYSTWSDISSLQFHPVGLLVDIALGVLTVRLLWKSHESKKCSGVTCSVLVLFAGAFAWLNTEAWYGSRPTEFLRTEGSPSWPAYGFPFRYQEVHPHWEVSNYPLWLLVDFLIGLFCFIFLRWIFHRRENCGLPNPPAPADR